MKKEERSRCTDLSLALMGSGWIRAEKSLPFLPTLSSPPIAIPFLPVDSWERSGLKRLVQQHTAIDRKFRADRTTNLRICWLAPPRYQRRRISNTASAKRCCLCPAVPLFTDLTSTDCEICLEFPYEFLEQSDTSVFLRMELFDSWKTRLCFFWEKTSRTTRETRDNLPWRYWKRINERINGK